MLSPTEEAQTRALIAQEAALLSLADQEPTIISNLGATDVSLSDLGAASSLNDADLLLVRQGSTDKSIAGSIVKAAATIADATDTVKGKVSLAVSANYPSVSDTEAATPAYVTSAISGATSPQIFTAPVPTFSAGAMTIPGVALSLDFRSSTLTLGTISRVAGTPASLVVPSGATLGLVSGQQSDIYVLALNNAGTIEYAVSNIAGGVNLNESGVISTTAISAGATSSSIVYSTTARTNVAYRVIALIRSTQTTAGTWAQTPSLIQGAGGQALNAMSSFGFGQTYQLLTGSRVAGTTYYNTTGKTIDVYIYTGLTSNSTPTVGGVSLQPFSAASGGTNCLTFSVPSGFSYSVSGSWQQWYELR